VHVLRLVKLDGHGLAERVDLGSGGRCKGMAGARALARSALSDPRIGPDLRKVDPESFVTRVARVARHERLSVLASTSRPEIARHFAALGLMLVDWLLVFDGSRDKFRIRLSDLPPCQDRRRFGAMPGLDAAT